MSEWKDRPEWQRFGSCRGMDPDLWFPDLGANADEAKRICRSCPVLNPCREWGITQEQTTGGIWGGLNGHERLRIRRARRRQGAA